MSDTITLTGIRIEAAHGVLAKEKQYPQTFIVDATLHLDLSKAGLSDKLSDTVDYGQIARRIVSTVKSEQVNLLEYLANKIATAILLTPAIEAVDVTIHKPQAPLVVPFSDVSVSIHRTQMPIRSVREQAREEAGETDEVLYGSSVNARQEAAAREMMAASRRAAEREVAAGREMAAHDVVDRAGTGGETTAAYDADAAQEPGGEHSPRVHHAIIAMGGNLGNVASTLRQAVVSMDALKGNQIVGISPLYRTTPWGMEENTPDFLNAVVELDTTMSAPQLLQALQLIEAAHGRTREVHWGSRPLDLDIIDFDGMVSTHPDLTLPHPRAWQRAFVLAPLADIDPDFEFTGEHGGPVTELLKHAPDRDGVEMVSQTWILGNDAVNDIPTSEEGE